VLDLILASNVCESLKLCVSAKVTGDVLVVYSINDVDMADCYRVFVW